MTRVMQRLNMSGGIISGSYKSDDFFRANNNSLGPNWLEIEPSGPSNIRIAGNRLHLDTAFNASARWNTALGNTVQPNQSVRALLAANNIVLPDAQDSGLGVRIAPDGATQRGYGFIRRTAGGVAHRSLVRFSDLGGVVVLADELGDFPILQHVMCAISGTILTGYLFTAGEWVLRLTVSDANYATGQPGFVTPAVGTATYFMEWDDCILGPTVGSVILGRRRAQYITSGAFRPRLFERQ